ncbi:MAG: hypothetical protein LC118_01650 [Dehalococcoidia bacterium]|nr:hypothetical protein [Dehalococcoidia bacterium]
MDNETKTDQRIATEIAEAAAKSGLSAPHWHGSVDWKQLVEEFAPPPVYFASTFRWSREQIAAVQLARLQAQVARAWATVPFYRRHWEERGFHPDDLKSLDDLTRISQYTVYDIRDSIERHPPFGDYQGFDWDEVAGSVPARIFFSGGTTGRSRPTLYTPWDREVGGIISARALWLQGLRPGYTVINNFAFSLHNAAWIQDEACARWLGCLPITASTGNVTSPEKQLEIMRDYKVDAVIAFGDYLVHLAAKARELGYDPREDFHVKALASTGSAEAVMDAWGVPALDAYGFHEVQYVSAEVNPGGGLYIFEDAFIVEVVDSETGAPLPDGEMGDLVVTCLYKTGSPQIRYNIKDLSRLYPPVDGLPRTMDHMLGRSDTMVKLRGVNVWPEAIGAIAAEDAATTGEYFVVAERDGNRDSMTCYVDLHPDADPADALERIEKALRARLMVAVNVDTLPADQLARLTGLGVEAKLRRFEDRRPRDKRR